ncbi:MAG: Hsp20/alpha crystallin family protein [Myxococcales bacterium]|nr:Hsp20/alpha crystallin family protein [Myxococcales bacterium]MCB9715346.1 Hsp20/alpha crystallin family protein [Myxococcales bacterium]
MADLKKWFPFKFKRNTGEAKAAEEKSPARVQATPASLFPAFGTPMGQLMARMLDDPFFTRPLSMFGEHDRFFGDFSPAAFTPSVDVVDEGKAVKVTAELPGLDKDDIQLDVHEGMLTLRGHKKHEEKHEEEGCYRTERFYGSFSRAVPLPVDVDLGAAEAKFDKGVLTVRFPKKEGEQKQQRIPVS